MPSTLSATSLLLLMMMICYVTLSLTTVEAFSPSCATSRISTSTTLSQNTGMSTTGFRRMASDDQDPDDAPTTKLSLEEKMAQWEATDEEKKAATLGGLIPEPVGGSGKSSGPEEPGSVERSDAFDVGLYIAFPIMVLSGLFFALFPFIMGSIDVDSVGPPPTI